MQVDFPRLPVREGEHVFAWFSSFADLAHFERFRTAFRQSEDWRATVPVEPLRQFMRKPELLIMMPTPRSLLR